MDEYITAENLGLLVALLVLAAIAGKLTRRLAGNLGVKQGYVTLGVAAASHVLR